MTPCHCHRHPCTCTCMDGHGTWMAMAVAKGHTIHMQGPTHTFPTGLLERPLMMKERWLPLPLPSPSMYHGHPCMYMYMDGDGGGKGTIFFLPHHHAWGECLTLSCHGLSSKHYSSWTRTSREMSSHHSGQTMAAPPLRRPWSSYDTSRNASIVGRAF